ncbi:vesicle coat protein [Amylocarpus encephaloides]|uniref:Vesicle coat protein n=1 Tax=Amylocarpus encephaloides TaxID=45428 RepID=A0A9P8C8W6_9HELO|nr:vesicle coat protein [Amylocarpus encephaloides]
MSSILCLAHYCDTHGPTPLMVTEALPVGCSTCFDEDESFGSRRASTSSHSLDPADGLAGIVKSSGRINSTLSDKGHRLEGTVIQRHVSISQPPSSSAMETPPESPRVATLQGGQGGNPHRRDSSFRKTYDENDKKRATPCENCALTLPKKTKEDTAGTSIIDNSGPILRTRKPYERVSCPTDEPSPPKSAASSASSDYESALTSKSTKRPYPVIRATTSSSNSSFGSSVSHDHFLDYTSTHEPLASTSFSIIRQSCLRTLSCETLPPSSSQFSNSSPTSPFTNSSFSNGPSSMATTSSGGPILFGDPQAGYTTAFIFRIPDPNARGRRRVYALMALSTHGERLAMQTFSFLSVAFRDLASWIQGLAEAELERTDSAGAISPRVGPGEGRQSAFNNTPKSSFLQGRNRGGDGKFSGMSLRSRGLAEIVALPDFFLELHARFVRLLIELQVVLGA